MIRRYIVAFVQAFILALSLTACASPDVAIQGTCLVPEKLDYVAPGPTPLQSVDTPLKKHLEEDIQERGAHRILADDFNALREHIKGCK